MERNDLKKAQGGFTLIEIIAVLVILGILAAVAVPKFLDLQDQARARSLSGAVAAAQSQVSMEYARQILSAGNEATAWTAVTTLGSAICAQVETDGFPSDFDWGTCTATGNVFNITATAGGQSASGAFPRPN